MRWRVFAIGVLLLWSAACDARPRGIVAVTGFVRPILASPGTPCPGALTSGCDFATGRTSTNPLSIGLNVAATTPITGVSSSSNTVGTGTKTFTITSSLVLSPTDNIILASTGDPTTFVKGTVTNYTSGTLTMSVVSVGNSGAVVSAWDLVEHLPSGFSDGNILFTSGSTSSGSTLPFTSTAGVSNNLPIYGGNIPANTTIASFVVNTSITLSQAISGTVPSGAPINIDNFIRVGSTTTPISIVDWDFTQNGFGAWFSTQQTEPITVSQSLFSMCNIGPVNQPFWTLGSGTPTYSMSHIEINGCDNSVANGINKTFGGNAILVEYCYCHNQPNDWADPNPVASQTSIFRYNYVTVSASIPALHPDGMQLNVWNTGNGLQVYNNVIQSSGFVGGAQDLIALNWGTANGVWSASAIVHDNILLTSSVVTTFSRYATSSSPGFSITAAADNGSGSVRLTHSGFTGAQNLTTGDQVRISGTGIAGLGGIQSATQISSTQFDVIGVPSGTLSSTFTNTTSGSTSSSSKTLPISNTSGIIVGQVVTAASGLSAQTFVLAINTNTNIVLSRTTTGTIGSGATLTFSPGFEFTQTALVHDYNNYWYSGHVGGFMYTGNALWGAYSSENNFDNATGLPLSFNYEDQNGVTQSNVASYNPTLAPPSPVSAAQGVSDTTIQMTFTTVANPQGSSTVNQYSLNGGTTAFVLAGTKIISGLTPATLYSVTVQSCDAANDNGVALNCGAWSAAATATTSP